MYITSTPYSLNPQLPTVTKSSTVTETPVTDVYGNPAMLTQETAIFDSNTHHLQALMNNPSLKALFGIDTANPSSSNINPFDPANAYSIPLNYDQDNVLQFLATSSASTVETAIDSLADLLRGYYLSGDVYSVNVNGQQTNQMQSTAIHGIGAEMRAVSQPNYDPIMDYTAYVIREISRLLMDPDLTEQGGMLAHLANDSPALIQELATMEKQLTSLKETVDGPKESAKKHVDNTKTLAFKPAGDSGGQKQA